MPVDARARRQDELFTDLHERLRGFVGRRIGDPHAADDVAQQVLLRIYRNLDELRIEDRLDAFAYRIARNAIIDHYRARARAKETPATPGELTTRIDADADTDEAGEDTRGRQELARCLEPLVKLLSEPYREALTLTDLGELSQVEAARVAGLSVPGMKARVQRARAQVHDLLTDCCAVALDNGQLGKPKSKRSSRGVPLALRVAGALDDLHRQSAFNDDDDLVFGHPHTGRPLDRAQVLKRFKRYCKAAGVRDKVRFHDLRHTFGTRMAAAGVPLRTLQEWMGHADSKTTQIYADYAPSANEAAIVDAAFMPPESTVRSMERTETN